MVHAFIMCNIKYTQTHYLLVKCTWDRVQMLHFRSSLGKAKRVSYAWILLTILLNIMPSNERCVPIFYNDVLGAINSITVTWRGTMHGECYTTCLAEGQIPQQEQCWLLCAVTLTVWAFFATDYLIETTHGEFLVL